MGGDGCVAPYAPTQAAMMAAPRPRASPPRRRGRESPSRSPGRSRSRRAAAFPPRPPHADEAPPHWPRREPFEKALPDWPSGNVNANRENLPPPPPAFFFFWQLVRAEPQTAVTLRVGYYKQVVPGPRPPPARPPAPRGGTKSCSRGRRTAGAPVRRGGGRLGGGGERCFPLPRGGISSRARPAPKYWELRGGSAAPPAQKRAGRHGGGAAPAPATAPLRRCPGAGRTRGPGAARL